VSDYARRQLLFEVGEHLFAAEAEEVCEVLEPTEATPIPGAVPGVHGLINLRGNLLVTGEFGRLLGLTTARGNDPALVVFEQGDRQVALEVDRVLAMAPTPASNGKGDLDVGSELLDALGAGALVTGVGQFGPRPYFKLDMRAVFERVLEQVGEGDRAATLGSTEGQG
jgi:chemotaxis signal transduction protein